MNIDKTIKKVEKYTKKHVKKSRFEHCKRVASMCVELCRLFNIDEKKGYLCGIGHDMCKDFPDNKMINIAKKDGLGISDYAKEHVYILHGRAASVKMKDKFKIKDEDVLQAVSTHVSAEPGMCNLAKILYISDKAEPGRAFSTDEYRAKLFKLSLNDMFIKVLLQSYEYIKKKGWDIYPNTLKTIEYYTGGNK